MIQVIILNLVVEYYPNNMPVDTKLYRVLIASPGDVTQERGIIRQQIANWNSMHSSDMKMVLMPLGCETDGTPDLEERGQAIINRQLVDNCDLLIAVFWTRLGTPTPQADSGTVEEIERAHNEGKRCIVYFSDKEAPPSGIDLKQYERLQKYQEELNKEGLTDTYKTIEEFREKVFRHITASVLEITKEDRERRAAEQEAKSIEQALRLQTQPVLTSPNFEISFGTLTEAQTSVKKLLESPFGVQDMEEVKEKEIAKVQFVLSSPDLAALLSQQPTVETISAIAQILETATTPSIYAIATICKYGNDSSVDWLDIVGDWIERLSTRKVESGYLWVSNIKIYPALLLLYTVGISALRSRKTNFLREALERQIYSLDYDREFNLINKLDPRSVFYDRLGKLIEPGFEQRNTPVSDHLAPLIKSKLYPYEEEVQYLNWFDLFEFLLSLKSVHLNEPYPYFGSFTWRWETNRFIIKSIQDAILQQGRYGSAILTIFNTEADLERTAQKYDTIASQSRSDFWRASPHKNVSKLIELAKSGTRITSYRDLGNA
jgi:nucleoside 2-deoxyribosyltransferase